MKSFIQYSLLIAILLNIEYCTKKTNEVNNTKMNFGSSVNTGKLSAPVDLSWSVSKDTPVGGQAMVAVNVSALIDLDSIIVKSQFPQSLNLVSGNSGINAGVTSAQTKLSETFYVTSNTGGTKTLTVMATIHVNGQTMSKVIGIDVFFGDTSVNSGMSHKPVNNAHNNINSIKSGKDGSYSDLPAARE